MLPQGTPAFMAPELAQTGDEYAALDIANGQVDVYSYGILLWVIATTEEPYHQINSNPFALMAQVVAGKRPPIDARKYSACIPTYLADLMVRCWDADPLRRPAFHTIVSELRSTSFKHIESLLTEPDSSINNKPYRDVDGYASLRDFQPCMIRTPETRPCCYEDRSSNTEEVIPEEYPVDHAGIISSTVFRGCHETKDGFATNFLPHSRPSALPQHNMPEQLIPATSEKSPGNRKSFIASSASAVKAKQLEKYHNEDKDLGKRDDDVATSNFRTAHENLSSSNFISAETPFSVVRDAASTPWRFLLRSQDGTPQSITSNSDGYSLLEEQHLSQRDEAAAMIEDLQVCMPRSER